MGNRVLAAKKRKMQRQRRAWAIPLSRSGGQTPNRIVINEYKHRARGLTLDDDISESVIQKLCHDHKKREALKRQASFELELGDALRYRGPGPNNEQEESWVYFNPQKTGFFILHKDKKLNIERKSVTFSSKEVLYFKWTKGKVRWVEIRDNIDFPNST